MKKFLYNSIALLLVVLFAKAAFAQTGSLSQLDKQEISQKLASLVQSIKTGNVQGVIELVEPNNVALRQDIQEQLTGGPIAYQLNYLPLDKNTEILGAGKVRVKARFAASGAGWNISGISTYFVFEKQNNHWLISDTDFHRKLGADYVFSILKKVFVFGGPIFLLLFAFWLWMLIDAAKRDFDDKAVWIVLLIFLNGIGAILYYFIIKRRNVTRKPLELKS